MDFSKMTKEELIDYINGLNEQNNGKYGLVWDREKEPEKIVVDCDKNIPILKEIKKKEISNGGQNNILIEGDNFHALSVLNYTHKEAIDVIYIDPPYNTGNQDFMYNDRFVDTEDGYRHSKWLNFMEKRLRIARELLKDDGVIFISIDDNEMAQLKLLCDQIFGGNNLISTMIWRKKYGGGKGTNYVVDLHEYILVYGKNKLNVSSFQIDRTEDQKAIFELEDKYIKTRGKYYIRPLKSGLAYRKNLIYPILCPDGTWVETQWICSKETFEELLNEDRIVFKKIKNDKYNVYKKFYEKDKGGTVFPESIIYDLAYNQNGKEEIKDLFNVKEGRDVPFNNAKPTKLIKYLLNFIKRDYYVILDFFAGSGTTGQAVMELNAEDGGNRKFILCTNNENNICEDVTYPRIKTVITGKRTDGSKYSDGLSESLKYYKTDFVAYSGTRDQLYYDLTEKCIPMLCVRGDTYNKVKVTDEYAIYTNDDKSKYSCIYFDILGQKYDEFLKEVKKIKELKQLYIFNLGDSVDKEPLQALDNYVVEPIPYKIIELYKKVVKMSKGE
jgi:adenine-specific DNA-methyltransferase